MNLPFRNKYTECPIHNKHYPNCWTCWSTVDRYVLFFAVVFLIIKLAK